MRHARATIYHSWSGWLVLLVVPIVVVLAACGGSTEPSVANIGSTISSTTASHGGGSHSRGASTAAVASGDPSRLLDEWAACMRRHGDPNQADPSVDAHKVIHIPWDPAVPGGYNGTNKGGQGNLGPGQYCRTYLAAAQSALRVGSPPQTLPNHAQLVKYAACMRANGVPDFPDPTSGGLNFNLGGDTNPQDPAFQRASKICAAKTGAHVLDPGNLPPGTITLTPA